MRADTTANCRRSRADEVVGKGKVATLSNDVQSGTKQPLAEKPSFFDFLRPSTAANILQTFCPVHRPQTSANNFLRLVERH
jgi:hypothetical protein